MFAIRMKKLGVAVMTNFGPQYVLRNNSLGFLFGRRKPKLWKTQKGAERYLAESLGWDRENLEVFEYENPEDRFTGIGPKN